MIEVFAPYAGGALEGGQGLGKGVSLQGMLGEQGFAQIKMGLVVEHIGAQNFV